jgi:hypothetical protein
VTINLKEPIILSMDGSGCTGRPSLIDKNKAGFGNVDAPRPDPMQLFGEMPLGTSHFLDPAGKIACENCFPTGGV